MKEFLVRYALSLNLCTSAFMWWIATFRVVVEWQTSAFLTLALVVSIAGLWAYVVTPRVKS